MELSNIIRKRDDAHPGSPEWMQYDLEINSIRQQRRDIEERWKTVLRGLGFVDEVETGILSPISTYSKQHSTISKSVQARDLYGRLVKESAMFSGCRWQGQSQRYLIIIERLIDLETAEDFVEAALELYPREKEYYGEEQDYQDED
nr:PREDICTED: melanoregulin-like [Saccoglossus kowalevskii]